MLIHNYLEADMQERPIHEGKGLCLNATVFQDSEIKAPIRFINYTILPPDTSFGLHTHGNDNEFYVVLEGNGIYEQDGEEQPVHAGDIMMNEPNTAHGIRNTGSEPMRLLVFEAVIAE